MPELTEDVLSQRIAVLKEVERVLMARHKGLQAEMEEVVARLNVSSGQRAEAEFLLVVLKADSASLEGHTHLDGVVIEEA